MKACRKVDTRPEVALRSELFKRGYRFRKNYRVRTDDRSIRIDIAFPRRRLAIFVDGCFWHCCPEHGNLPKLNEGYWKAKLARNVSRDRAVDRSLGRFGWRVVRVWEHVIAADACDRVEKEFANNAPLG